MQRRLRRVVAGLAGAFLLWLGVLAIAGFAGRGCAKDRAQARLAGSMRAVVTIGDLDLGLIRGAIGVDDIHIARTDRGYLRIDVEHVDVDLMPLGLALVQDGVGDVRVRGVEVEISALGALDLRGGKSAPLHFDSLVVERAHIIVEASHILPGVARLELTIDRAVAGPTTLRTPLSWLFGLRELTAHAELPLTGVITISYAKGKLRLGGGVFGSSTIELPFDIPVLDPARELEQLAALGEQLARELAAQGASRWKDRAADEIRKRLP